jgi:hypothetical protein
MACKNRVSLLISVIHTLAGEWLIVPRTLIKRKSSPFAAEDMREAWPGCILRKNPGI